MVDDGAQVILIIIFSICIIRVRVILDPEPIPVTLGKRLGHALDGIPVHQRVSNTHIHTCMHTLTQYLQFPFLLHLHH